MKRSPASQSLETAGDCICLLPYDGDITGQSPLSLETDNSMYIIFRVGYIALSCTLYTQHKKLLR